MNGDKRSISNNDMHKDESKSEDKGDSLKTSEKHRLKMFEIHQFADKIDICLMIMGIIAALATGASTTLLYYLARQIVDNLHQLGRNSMKTNQSLVQSNECRMNNSSNMRSPFDVIQLITKYYVIIGFISICLFWIAWSSWMIAAERQIRRIRYQLFRNILSQEIGWFDVHNVGELNNRLTEDLDKIKNGINEKVPDLIALMSRTIGAISYALIIGWKLTLIFLSVSPLIILTYRITIAVIVKYSAKQIKAYDQASSIAQEVFENIRTVTSFHGQEKEEERYSENLILAKKVGIRKSVYMGICQGLGQLLNFTAFTVTFWYGPQFVRTECQNYTPGTLIVVFIACMTSTAAATQFIPIFQNFAEASASGSFVFDMIKRKSKIDVSSDEGTKPEFIKGDIEFENVVFNYPTRQESKTLQNLSMKITSGTTIALVGASGCGKSTIIQLIQRFYDPDDGRILIDGNDIKTLNVSWLRSHIGVVSQEPVLFDESIEDNIRMGKLDATDDEVITAAKMANAHDFIMNFPDTYKTLAGDKLSGGEKQRVAIARALISDPKILLLDEATSALDYTSERLVQDALNNAKRGRTTIIVAHRLSTIQNADLIIGLKDGQVIEYGTHDELMNKKGLYYELAIEQGEMEKNKSISGVDTADELQIKSIYLQKLSAICIKVKELTDSMKYKTNDCTKTSSDGESDEHFYSLFIFRVLKYNTPEWYWIVIGSIASIIFGGTQPAFAYLYSGIYGLFAEPNEIEQKHLMKLYAMGILLTGILGAICQFLLNVAFGKSGEELTVRKRKLTFSSILRQEIGYFDLEKNLVATLTTRLASDASAIKGLTGLRIGILLQGFSALFVSLLIGFISGWKLTLAISCFIPLMFLSSKLDGQRQGNVAKTKDKNSYVELGGQCAIEAIAHIRTIVALHQENHFINIYEEAFNKEFKKSMWRLHLVALSVAVANSLKFFIYAVNFSYGSILVQKGEMTFENVYRISAVIIIAAVTVGQSAGQSLDYSKGRTAAIKIMNLIKRSSRIDPQDASGTILENIQGNIEFQHVEFRYPARLNVRILKDFSLTCVTNGSTALVGPSGSGKSTTIDLLQRFYDPLEGQILFDGHDIRTLNVRWLRSLMGFVQQEPVLFNLSIRDNIAYGDNDRQVSQEEIEEAAKIANIHDSIISLPKGYDTLCGRKGAQLSGGQKQRITIARALIRNPKILLFDEATSALDNNSESVVQKALDNAKFGRTCLTIAHRLSTIRDSDKIVVIDQGQIKEEGIHNELLKSNGIYSKMIASQERGN